LTGATGTVAGLGRAGEMASARRTASFTGATQLKPGDYKFEMQGDKVVFKEGKTVIAEVAATSETAAKKYSDTTYESTDGKITAIKCG